MSIPADRSFVSPWLHALLRPIHRGLLRLYFGDITLWGQEHLPDGGPAVLAVKHYSRWDPLVIALLSQQPLHFMTNQNQFEGLQGWFIQRLGAFPVNLTKPQLSSLRYAVELLHQGHKLVIFPEGGIVRDQPLRSLKPGLARLVLQAESTATSSLSIPILPIGLRYDPHPVWQARIRVHIGPPLYAHQFTAVTEKQRADKLTQALQQAILACLSEADSVAQSVPGDSDGG